MISKFRLGCLRTGCLILLALVGLLHPALAVDPDATALNTNDSLRSYLEIQEQLHNTQLAIEKSRNEAEVAAASNSLAMELRLRTMEQTFNSERIEELRAIQHSSLMILICSGAFAAVGFVVLLLAAFMQWTAINRLSAAAASLSVVQSSGALGGVDAHLPAQVIEQSTTRFLGLIEQLEHRIHDLEGSVKAPQSLPESSLANVAMPGPEVESAPVESLPSGSPGEADAVTLLLNKSQTLLKLDQPEAALGCLEEVLALDPANAEALVKKGSALERLQRFDEAIQCYDRAIAKDNTMTMAYLYKGGVFNRMERYSEALACYEQALKTRHNGQAANVIIE